MHEPLNLPDQTMAKQRLYKLRVSSLFLANYSNVQTKLSNLYPSTIANLPRSVFTIHPPPGLVSPSIMKHLPLLLLAGEAATAQPRVFQNLVQHFESAEMGPFIPFVELGFGAAPALQPITGIFDTGSSDTIVPEAGSEVCQQARQQCTAPAPVVLGQFDPAAAAAAGDFRRLDGQRFNATFGGGDQYDGDYIKTSVVLGQDGQGRVAGAQVALASHSEPRTELPQVPVFGLGSDPERGIGEAV